MFKYKIGFMVLSNRPHKLKRFQASIEKMPWLRNNAAFGLVYQQPVIAENYTFYTHSKKIDDFNYYRSNNLPLPMVQLRRHGLNLLQDCEYICCLDDDHEFVEERIGKNYPKSSEQYYIESLEWMDKNNDVGILSQRGYFGGYAWGYEPKKNPNNGLIENNAGGILCRNIGIDTMFPKECHEFVGVMSEPLIGYNIVAKGYNFAKRFNCPNKFEAPGSNKHVNSGSNISYSEEVCNKNVQGYIRKKFDDPNWRHSSKKYPKLIAEILGVKQ